MKGYWSNFIGPFRGADESTLMDAIREVGDALVRPREDAPRGWRQPTHLLDKIEEREGCLLWRGARNSSGYASITRRVAGRCTGVLLHKFLYVVLIDDVAEGDNLDHLCRNRECINPFHLEPVTSAENTRRGVAAKMSDEDRQKALALFEAGLSKAAVAREVGHPLTTVKDFLNGRTWAGAS